MDYQILGFIVVILGVFGEAQKCSKFGIYCLNSKEYRLCIDISVKGGMFVGPLLVCPEGLYCNADNRFPCSTEKPATIPPSTTTTEAPVTPPTCTKAGKYQGPTCYQYYECVKSWWSYKVVLKTCDKDLAFNPTTKSCESAEELNCKFDV